MEELPHREDMGIFENWKFLKQNAKVVTIERGYVLAYERKREQRWREKALQSPLFYVCPRSNQGAEDIAFVRSQLKSLKRLTYREAAVRARAERLLLGEVPTKRCLSEERRFSLK